MRDQRECLDKGFGRVDVMPQNLSKVVRDRMGALSEYAGVGVFAFEQMLEFLHEHLFMRGMI
jgi:hypothetical protein